MNRETRVVRACFIVVALALPLAGCGEPSASEMKQALGDNFQWKAGLEVAARFEGRRDINNAVRDYLANGVVEKYSCASAQGAPGHTCDFRFGMPDVRGQMQYGEPVKGRFFKSGNVWAVEFMK